MSPAVADLPPAALIGLGLIGLVQLSLEVVALVVLVRTPRDRVQLGVRWPWALAIVLVSVVGAVVFLAAGRRPAPAEDPVLAPVPDGDQGQVPAGRDAAEPRPTSAVDRAVDLLYQDHEPPEPRS